jgi:hypothetical protein
VGYGRYPALCEDERNGAFRKRKKRGVLSITFDLLETGDLKILKEDFELYDWMSGGCCWGMLKRSGIVMCVPGCVATFENSWHCPVPTHYSRHSHNDEKPNIEQWDCGRKQPKYPREMEPDC